MDKTHKTEETFVFIDSQYLSIIAKHLFGRTPHYFINGLAYTLAKEQGLWCKGVFYYTAPPYQDPIPAREDAHRRHNYDRFINNLKKIEGFTVREGRCQKVDGEFHEKGVDALMTMDLMETAYKDKMKKIILIACDTDFVPVLNRLRESHGVTIILYYFTDRVRGSRFSMSNHILTACDKTVLLKKGHFEQNMMTRTEESSVETKTSGKTA